ncbi:MAG: hypothetical protein ACRYGI_12505, partial [Janthinobacterium lividum]
MAAFVIDGSRPECQANPNGKLSLAQSLEQMSRGCQRSSPRLGATQFAKTMVQAGRPSGIAQAS